MWLFKEAAVSVKPLIIVLAVLLWPGLWQSDTFFFLSFFLGLQVWHMELLGPVIKSELQLLAYVTATANWDLSCIFDPYHSARQHQILNSLIKARDQIRNLMVPSRICFCCTLMGTPRVAPFKVFLDSEIELTNTKV